MKTKGRRLLHRLSGMLFGACTFGLLQLTAVAGNTEDLSTLNVGAAAILDADLSVEDTKDKATEKSDSQDTEKNKDADKGTSDEDDAEESNLVMANVQDAVNVRKDADEESEKVGKLYRDCGGEILERRNGWTKLKSGNLVGWTKDEFLIFGKEAEEMAEDVGGLVATIKADALRVRKEPEADSGVFGLIGKNEKLDAIEVIDDKWVSVEYEGDMGYISAEYVSVEFVIGTGETLKEIKEREEKALEEKRKADAERAKQIQNLGAVAVGTTDEMLLAALIQCEAGGQPYEGQLAVGAVVMNRVKCGGYPDTIAGVIYAPGQFSPALNGAVERRIQQGVKPSCIQAAQEAIAGASNVGSAMHFRRAGKHDGQIIGNHVFW